MLNHDQAVVRLGRKLASRKNILIEQRKHFFLDQERTELGKPPRRAEVPENIEYVEMQLFPEWVAKTPINQRSRCGFL